MKKKAKRYQEGGVLRDRYGNPVKSGSGETVRTSYPERSYNEQSTADMTESSDYSGRRRKSPERSTSDEDSDSTYMPSGRAPNIGYGNDSEASSLTERLRRASPGSNISKADGEGGGYTSPVKEVKEDVKPKRSKIAKPKASKSSAPDESAAEKKESPKASQMFPTRSIEDITKDTKTATTPKRGFGPKITFGTPAQLEKAKKAYYSGFKSGGSVSSASKRADGIAQKGKTRGRIC